MVALHKKPEPLRSSVGIVKMIQPQFEIIQTMASGPGTELAILEIVRIVPVYAANG